MTTPTSRKVTLAERIGACCPCGCHGPREFDCSHCRPLHALEAEVDSLDASRLRWQTGCHLAEKRAEVAEALLREAPEPDDEEIESDRYRAWLARVRAAVGTKGGGSDMGKLPEDDQRPWIGRPGYDAKPPQPDGMRGLTDLEIDRLLVTCGSYRKGYQVAFALGQERQRRRDAEFVLTHRATHYSGGSGVGGWRADPLEPGEQPDKVAQCLAAAIEREAAGISHRWTYFLAEGGGMKSALWLCGPPRRDGRRQGFPSRFWTYFLRDFAPNGTMGLHLFGGSAPDWPRVDSDPESGAEFVQDAFAPPPSEQLGLYDVVLADPPYTKKFSGDWGVEQPSPKAILEAARLWTHPGGLIAMLHILVPARPKWAEREAIIGVLSGPHNVIRCLSVFRLTETSR